MTKKSRQAGVIKLDVRGAAHIIACDNAAIESITDNIMEYYCDAISGLLIPHRETAKDIVMELMTRLAGERGESP